MLCYKLTYSVAQLGFCAYKGSKPKTIKKYMSPLCVRVCVCVCVLRNNVLKKMYSNIKNIFIKN